MAKSASPVATSELESKPNSPRLRKRRTPGATLGRQLEVASANSAAPTAVTPLDLSASLKPLLIGVGIGAALVGTALAVRSRDREGASSPFHGPNAALAGSLTKTALFAVARAMSGETLRTVATRALLEVAEAWKA